jgi:hypothetical protein
MNCNLLESRTPFWILLFFLYLQIRFMCLEGNFCSAFTLEPSISVEEDFEGEETIHWYTITPSAEDIGNITYFRVNLQSQEKVTVTVYAKC